MTIQDFETLFGLFIGCFGFGLSQGYLIGLFKMALKSATNR